MELIFNFYSNNKQSTINGNLINNDNPAMIGKPCESCLSEFYSLHFCFICLLFDSDFTLIFFFADT